MVCRIGCHNGLVSYFPDRLRGVRADGRAEELLQGWLINGEFLLVPREALQSEISVDYAA